MVRLITYNIEYGEATTRSILDYTDLKRIFSEPKHNDEDIAEFLAALQPDILGLVEVDLGSLRNHHQDESQRIADILELPHITVTHKYGGTPISDFLGSLPFMQNQVNAVLTKTEPKHVETITFEHGIKTKATKLRLNTPEITIILIHLALFKSCRAQQLRELIHHVNNTDGPVIVSGDFNTFKPKELRELLTKTKLRDAYNTAKHKTRLKFTEPSWNPKHRLDNVLATPEIHVENHEIINVHYSDHLPVLIDFTVA